MGGRMSKVSAYQCDDCGNLLREDEQIAVRVRKDEQEGNYDFCSGCLPPLPAHVKFSPLPKRKAKKAKVAKTSE